MRKAFQFLFLALLFSLNNSAQHPANSKNGGSVIPDSILSNFLGSWKGVGSYEGKSRNIELNISVGSTGKMESSWSIRDAGIFRKPFTFSFWNQEKNSLLLENGFFELKYDNGRPGQIQVKISRHGATIDCIFDKIIPEILPYKLENISFSNGSVKLAGTLSIPNSAHKMPAVIFLHGSSDGSRWDWAPFFADILSRMGIVCLFYDKRGSGESTGSWIASSLDDLSDDANKAMEYLQTLDYVDKDNIGFWGFSQSGWVAPNCLKTNTKIAFMIICSGGANSPREVELFGYKNTLLQKGMTQEQVDSAFTLAKKYFDYLESKISLGEIENEIKTVRNSSWYKFINLERVLPSESNRKNWRWVADYDPLPSIRTINFPLLLVFGENDVQTNVPVAVQKWNSALSKKAVRMATIKIFEKGNHGIKLGDHSPGSLLFWQEFAPGYLDLIKDWAKKNILRNSK